MILYIMVTALTVLAACFVSGAPKEQTNHLMRKSRQETLNGVLVAGIFLVLFSLSALRVGIGNDYWVYRYNFLHIIDGNAKVPYEIGFKVLVRVLQGLFGYDNYRVVFAFMSFVTCAFFMRGLFDSSDWFALSFFLFMANGFYFMSFSNVRYYFAVAVCVYAMKFLFRKDFVKFVFWILFAAFFHKSVLLVIPAYLAAYYLKWTKKTIWLIPASCAALLFGKPLVRRLVFVFYPFYEGDLILDVESISYVNIAKCAAVLILSLLYYRRAVQGDSKAETLFNLNLFALIIYSLGYYIPETSRVCYYMVVGQVFLIPMVLKAIPDKRQKAFFTGSVAACFAVYLLVFLVKGRESTVLLLPYLTWVFG